MPLTVSDLLVGPLIAFAVVGLLAVVLRLVLGGRESRWSARWTQLDTGPTGFAFDAPADFGLLRTVALTADREVADAIRNRLADAGIRATLAAGPGGTTRVLVFEERLEAARRVVSP